MLLTFVLIIISIFHHHSLLYSRLKTLLFYKSFPPWPFPRTVYFTSEHIRFYFLLFLIFTFYRAMLCIRGTSHGPVSVCLSVRPSQVGVLLKQLNVGSHKQHHTIVQGL